MTDDSPGLTRDQMRVAQSPPDQLTLVTAGPGTGKTHTLIARLTHLVQEHGLSPGHEVLVLSFSRAAVQEIRERTRGSSDDSKYVQALTFDSFATRLLAEADPSGGWIEAGYDGRIAAATRAILDSDEAAEVLESVRHVVIDEVQDLVGVREALVRALLLRVAGGFTIFGDPAQGIYNFQLEDPEQRAKGSAAFYEWLLDQYADRIVHVEFEENHRATTPSARQALWAGPEIHRATPKAYTDIWDRLQALLLELKSIGSIKDSAPELLRSLPNRTAVLCRTNGQALMCSRQLWEKGVAHVYRRGALDRAVPSWVATLFSGYEYSSITRTNFATRVGSRLGGTHDPQVLWASLKRLDPSSESSLNLHRVAERIRTQRVPDELIHRAESNLVVSTIHRAKGLEFDTVVIAVGPTDSPEVSCELAEETRVLYVALTRPKRALLRVDVPRFRGLFHHERADRWVRKFGWRASDFEVVPDDVDRLDPAGSKVLSNGEPASIQSYLASRVRPGDALTLRLITSSVNGMPRAFYAVEHEGNPVGLTSEHFAARLHSFLKLRPGWEVRWPLEIAGLRVDGVDTVAGLPATSRKYDLGETGLWLRVRATGLGRLQF